MAENQNADQEVIYQRTGQATASGGQYSGQDVIHQRNRQARTREKVLRQYACESCDNIWWSSDQKLVSTCRKCLIKYEPVPEDRMFGWAQFECKCGNKFSGFGQMNITASECYESKSGCGMMVYPTSVKPPRRRQERRTDSSHSCDAPDCWRRKDSRGTGQSSAESKCVHPKGKKKRVICSSAPHRTRE